MTEKHTCDHHQSDSEQDQHALNQEDLGAAGNSLAEAFRISFVILKVIMIVVVIAFFASGFQTIGPEEQGIVLRFGKIKVVDSDGGVTLDSGLRWTFPYPIDELIKIPVAKQINLGINTFWYDLTAKQALGEGPKKRRAGPKLNPEREGYSLTSGESLSGLSSETQGSDYNIVHSRWQITYKVKDARLFYQNVYVRDPKPGDVYEKLMREDVKPLLQSCLEDAVVSALVHFNIDEAIESKAGIRGQVRNLVQAKLDAINSGIGVVSVQLSDITWPQQVDAAFNRSITASNEAKTKVSEAKTYAESLLNQTAGALARDLANALHDDSMTDQAKEALWAQLAGNAQVSLAQARAYRTEVVESAKARADYFERLLPEFRKRPELVVKNLYLDTIAEVMENVDEKFVLEEGTDKGKELRILLNRDPALKTRMAQKNNNPGSSSQ
jgi:modulator of FtsH protease HflK